MIIPHPAEIQRAPRSVRLPAALRVAADPGARQAADLLAGYLGPDRPRTDDGPVIRLSLSGNGHGAEGYRLDVATDGSR